VAGLPFRLVLGHQQQYSLKSEDITLVYYSYCSDQELNRNCCPWTLF